MKLPKRFALSTLLLLMLVVASVFGYAQWRRQQFIADVKWLNSINGSMIVGRGVWVADMQTLPTLTVRDGVWPTVIVVNDPLIHDNVFSAIDSLGGVPLCFAKVAGDTYRLAGDKKEYGLDDLKSRLVDIQDRLNAVGIKNVELWQYENRHFGLGRNVMEDVNSIGE